MAGTLEPELKMPSPEKHEHAWLPPQINEWILLGPPCPTEPLRDSAGLICEMMLLQKRRAVFMEISKKPRRFAVFKWGNNIFCWTILGGFPAFQAGFLPRKQLVL